MHPHTVPARLKSGAGGINSNANEGSLVSQNTEGLVESAETDMVTICPARNVAKINNIVKKTPKLLAA